MKKKTIYLFFILFFVVNKSYFVEANTVSTEYTYAIITNKTQNVFYTSNIAGDPIKKNSNGYISKLNSNLNTIEKYFIIGLNSPKGMCLLNNLLYIADLSSIKIFDINTKQKIHTINFGSIGSNLIASLASDNEQFIYAANMLKNQIIRIDTKNDYIWDCVTEGVWLDFPSSIYYDKKENRLLIGTFFYGKVFEFLFNDKSVRTLIPNTINQINAIVLDDNRDIYFGGGVKDGAIYKFKNKKLSLVKSFDAIPGGICINNNETMLVPLLYRKKIQVVELHNR